MQISQEQNHLSYSIRAYASGQVDIIIPTTEVPDTEQGSRFDTLTTSFIMLPKRLIRDWPPQTLSDLAGHHLEVLLQHSPEVVLLGTGNTLIFPDMEIMTGFMEQGIGFEVMDNAAACRTYNILMNEGRHVALAILM